MKAINWWYVLMGIFGLVALTGGAFYAISRNFGGVLLLILFGALAFGCFYKGSRSITNVPTLTAEAPTSGKVNCLCIYGVRDQFNINRAVKIQFEVRLDSDVVQAKIAPLKAKGGDILGKGLEDWEKALLESYERQLEQSVSSKILNSDRWLFEDINKWLPVIYTDLSNEGQWAAFELPDAKYTDPARLVIPLNMSAVQKWRELETGLFEKLKPIIMLVANLIVLFFMFLLASNPIPQ